MRLGVLVLVVLASPLAAAAQDAGKVWRIGLLSAYSVERDQRYRAALQDGLRDLNYVGSSGNRVGS